MPEIEESPTTVPLGVLMARNPDAFKFDDIRADPEDIGEIADLETMLGQHTQVRGRFYSRPLKAKQQKTLIRIAQQAGDGSNMLQSLDGITEALRQILCIEEGEQYRECTVDEIDDAFSIQEQAELLRDLSGLNQTEGVDGGPK